MSSEVVQAARRYRTRTATDASGDLFAVGQSSEHSPHLPIPLLLRKNTNAVHVRTEMTCLQRKVLNVLLKNAYNDLGNPGVAVHCVSVLDLSSLVGFDSNNTAHLKKALLGLVQTSVEYNLLDEPGGETWGASTLLAHAKLTRGLCYYEFSTFMRSKLYHPDRFANLDLTDIRELTTTSSVALYENAVRFAGLGRTPYFALPVLRQLLAAEAPTYDDFRRFSSKVIGPAVAQINERTGWNIKQEYRYEHRSVSEVRFLIERKARPSARAVEGEGPGTAEAGASLVDRLQAEMSLSEVQARECIERYGEALVEECSKYVAKQYALGHIKKIGAYFMSTMPKFRSEGAGTSLPTPVSAATKQEDAAQQARTQKALDDAFKVHWIERLSGALASLETEAHAALVEQFVAAEIAPQPDALRDWNAKGMESPAIAAMWRLFAARALLPSKAEERKAWDLRNAQ